MTFGYCFSPCVARLTTYWNELEPRGLLKKNCNGFFGYKLKGNGVSLGNLICLNVVFLVISVKLLSSFWLFSILIKRNLNYLLLKHGKINLISNHL